MRGQGILHLLLFVAFFSIGAAALGTSVLCDDLIQYWRNKHHLTEAERSLQRLESLNAEYDALLAQIESDPNLLQRIAPVTLGTEPADPNAIYPKARARELAIARKALLDKVEEDTAEPPIPHWLERASEPVKRLVLFIAGAGLVVISLVCFTPEPSASR
jgi:hypothetical protein